MSVRVGRLLLLPDTHAHLDVDVFEDEYDEVIARAVAAGVSPILAVGTDLASSLQAVEVAARFRSVYAAVGIHPHEAGCFHEQAGSVRQLLTAPKVVAVGEIGLDYFRGAATRIEQREAFSAQLAWAEAARLPVSVHNRDADDEVLDLLEGFAGCAVLHCFSGSASLATRAIAGGHFLSFAGNLTFPRADDLRAVATSVPLERTLTETDSPVLAPQSRRGRRNEPAFVTETARRLADLHHQSIENVSQIVAANAAKVFRWSVN